MIKALKIMLEQEGYIEKATNSNLYDKKANAGKNNYTKYGKEMGCNGQPWCDGTVDWCFKEAYGANEAKRLLGGFSNYTPTSAQYFKNMKCWHTSNPKVGDIIFFKNTQRICHTGMVYKVDSQRVYTIEGNTTPSAGVEANGGGVYRKSYLLNYNRIAGYGRPPYTKEQLEGKDRGVESLPQNKIKIGVKVRVTASELNIRKTPNGNILGRMSKGKIFTVKDIKEGWVKCCIKQGSKTITGWVFNKFVEVV